MRESRCGEEGREAIRVAGREREGGGKGDREGRAGEKGEPKLNLKIYRLAHS